MRFKHFLTIYAAAISLIVSVEALIGGNMLLRSISKRINSKKNILNMVQVAGAGLSINSTDELKLKNEIDSMRASQIKKMLTSVGADTKGLYDKADLAQQLLRLELEAKASGEVVSVPMHEVALGNTKQTYVGLDLEIDGSKFRFMVDTGATMNIVRQETVSRLGASSRNLNTYTVGMGGGGEVAASQTRIENIRLGSSSGSSSGSGSGSGSRVVSMEAAILKNAQALPPSSEGILGLSFLQSLGDVVEFDFDKSLFSFGSRKALLSPMRKQLLHEIPTRRIFSGLIVADMYVNDKGAGAAYTAMVDMGSAHTIANPLAVTAITDGAKSLDNLPMSQNMCAGIDGRPVPMRSLTLDSIKIGSEFTAAGPLTIYAADIPGLVQIGLGAVPAFILGMDVMGKHKLLLDIDQNRLYLKK